LTDRTTADWSVKRVPRYDGNVRSIGGRNSLARLLRRALGFEAKPLRLRVWDVGAGRYVWL